MKPFQYVKGASADAAIRAVSSTPGAVFYAGGTTLVDLMKIDVMTPDALVDIRRLPLASIDVDEAGAHVGANVSNSQLAWHPAIRERYPVLSEAILAGASTQLRNMASTAGNIMQRTRCPYFRDVHSACNKRQPGSGCAALQGVNRMHAILGASGKCIAVYPSDMAAALAVLNAVVRTQKPDGSIRMIPFNGFHLLPGETPERETVLEHGELITHVDLPPLPGAWHSHYLKVRDRASYEFALVSAALALELDGGMIRAARVALGGVATRPWRCPGAEQVLAGQRPTDEVFRAAADAALKGAVPQKHNAFKVELAKRTLVRALKELTARLAQE
jgi:xanthine dehydrogenase YagS FAD-binding subunit